MNNTPYRNILSKIKIILKESLKHDAFLKCGDTGPSVNCGQYIIHVSTRILTNFSFFKNIFNDCQIPLHEGKPLISLEGFDFLNGKNVKIFYNSIESLMSLEENIIIPSTASEQIEYMFILDYFAAGDPDEMFDFWDHIDFVKNFWIEFWNYSNIVALFDKNKIIKNIQKYQEIIPTIRDNFYKVWKTMIYSKEESKILKYHYYYRPVNNTFYYVNMSGFINEVCEVERLSPFIGYDDSENDFYHIAKVSHVRKYDNGKYKFAYIGNNCFTCSDCFYELKRSCISNFMGEKIIQFCFVY
jgi:hypothetical protein